AASFADAVMEAGDEHGIVPAGLGARDTLRLEAGMLLYGNDMDESRTPVEARLGWIVKPDKGEFLGRDRIVEQLEEGTAERLVGLEVEGRGIPRPGYAVAVDEERVGTVTSGTFSPTLEVGIGLAYVRAEHAQPETAVELEIRDRRVPARIVKTPFYRRER
ncbi:MAG: glycine cleavage T C-terminal barrel domain-containing protein, partial [Acidobacteriota bacterium]